MEEEKAEVKTVEEVAVAVEGDTMYVLVWMDVEKT